MLCPSKCVLANSSYLHDSLLSEHDTFTMSVMINTVILEGVSLQICVSPKATQVFCMNLC